MDVLIRLPRAASQKQLAGWACALLEGAIAVNMDLLRTHTPRLPALYTTSVKYRLEPAGLAVPSLPPWLEVLPPGLELFDNVIQCLSQGWADCDDLTAWRCAELRVHGEDAKPHVVWPKGMPRYHARVRRGNGELEDPSLIMRRKNG